MTPAARIADAIDILDTIRSGTPAEQSLTNWARANRYAGSGDRAAVRDLVFDALRRRRSLAWQGGAETGRGLMIGHLREAGDDPAAVFTGHRYAPPPLTADEASAGQRRADAPPAVRYDLPDWLWPYAEDALGSDTAKILDLMRHRAPVCLRANLARIARETAITLLAEDDITAEAHKLSPSALVVTANSRRVQSSTAYRDGLVELQDAASQAVVDRVLPHAKGRSVLDYCAGGGGKALHLAAGGASRVVAHDADPARMRDLPERARRAGSRIEIARRPEGQFDVVLTDVPCSGSGAWRRQPDGKWQLTPERLAELTGIQAGILEEASAFVRPGGVLAYATCSLWRDENERQVEAFLQKHNGWREVSRDRFTPADGGDGFFVAVLKKSE